MYPTRAQVKTRFLSHLDDPQAEVFTEAVFSAAFAEAYDALFNVFLQYQVPRVELITYLTLPAFTTHMTPVEMGIPDFGDYIKLAERTLGSNEQYRDLMAVDDLIVRPMQNRLLNYCYRNDTFYFVGALVSIDLEVKYDGSSVAPTDDNTVITVDNALTFLANYAVGVAGQRKGYDQTAQRCMSLAVGPRYDAGQIGGELLRMVQSRVRSRQHVQIAPKPYSVRRRLGIARALPYVAAQQGTTGGGATNVPMEFSTQAGTIIGMIDGTNKVFWMNIGSIGQATVFWNGVLQTEGVDYTRLNNQITFLVTAPSPGDIVTVEGYLRW